MKPNREEALEHFCPDSQPAFCLIVAILYVLFSQLAIRPAQGEDRGEKLYEDGPTECAALTRDGCILITGDSSLSTDVLQPIPSQIRLWDFESRQLIRVLPANLGDVKMVVPSPDGKWLAAIGYRLREDPRAKRAEAGAEGQSQSGRRKKPPEIEGAGCERLQLWNLEMFEQVPLDGETSKRHWGCAFFPESSRLAIATMGEVSILNLRSMTLRTPVKHARDEEVWKVAISPDGSSMATGGGFQGVKLWTVPEEGKPRLRGVLECPGFVKTGLAFSPDGKFVVAASSAPREKNVDKRQWGMPEGHALLVFDASTGKLVRSLPGHPRTPILVTFSADGRMMATSGHDDIVQLWSYPGFKELYRGPLAVYCFSLCLSPEGKQLITTSCMETLQSPPGGSFSLRIWDTESLIGSKK